MHSDKEKFGVLLPIILISYFMILLDNSIVFTSTVKIAQDLSLNGQTLAWVTNAYALTFGSLLLLGGRLGDLIGRKQIFLIGISIFSIGSLLVGASQNAGMIIGMRALQGIGAAVLAPTTLALIMDNYQGTMRTRAIAYYGATAGLGASVGLVIGGLIASYFSWRLGFLLNVPVGLVLAIMGARYIKNQSKSRASLDWAGTFFSVVGLVALVYGINGAKRPIMMFLLAIISLGLFGWREDHTNDPLMPLVLFKNTERFTAYVARFFYAGAVLSYFFLTPQAMQRSLGFTPLLAAIGFLPETVPQFVSATAVARLTERFGNTRVLMAGVVTTLIGFILGGVIGVQRGYLLGVALPMLFIGVGQGLALGPLTSAGVAQADVKMAGSASGVVNTVHQIGSSVGLSTIVVFAARWHSPAQYFNVSEWAMVGLTTLTLIAVLIMATKMKATSKKSN